VATAEDQIRESWHKCNPDATYSSTATLSTVAFLCGSSGHRISNSNPSSL